MSNLNFYIVGKHPVIEALKNPSRKVIKLLLTEESKKTIHREDNKVNLLKDVKVYFKTKKELDKYCKNENILHQGYVAEIEKLEDLSLKEFIKIKKNKTFVCLQEVTDPRNIGSIIRSALAFNIDGIIVLITGRRESVREVTERELRRNGIPFDMLIMGFADTGRVLINDINWKGKVKAHAVNMNRDEGFENINWEEYEL